MNRKIKKMVLDDQKLSLEQELELLASDEHELIERYLSKCVLYTEAEIALVKLNNLDWLKLYCEHLSGWLHEGTEVFLLQTGNAEAIGYYISHFGLYIKSEMILLDLKDNRLIKKYLKRSKMSFEAEKKLLNSGRKNLILYYLEKTYLDTPLQLELFGLDKDYIYLYIRKHNLSVEAQEKLLEINDKEMIDLYVKHHPFVTEKLQIDFLKKATFETINEYCMRWQLSNVAQIELVKNLDWELVKTYLNRFELCNHAWQLFMTKIHIGLC